MSEPASPPRPSVARATGDVTHPHRLAGYLLAAGAATSWGAQTIVAKLLLTSGLPAASLVSTRTALAALFLTAAIALARPALLRVSPGALGRLALLGIAGMSLSNYTYYLTLSLIPHFSPELFRLETPGARLNYGVNKVRFPNPVKVGSRIRASAQIAEVSDVPAGKQMVTRYTIEIEGEAKPACVAETVVLLLN